MRRLLIVIAALAVAVLVAVSCTEQSPDKYLAPEFGQVEVVLEGLKATVQCNVIGPGDGFSYGFTLRESGETKSQEISIKPYGGVLKAEFNGLEPSTDYCISAFATNGINIVISAENKFRTAKEEDVEYVVFPDSVFENFILSKFDNDNDGLLSFEEAESISEVECCSDDIRSIEGVEYFTNLERFICNGSGTEYGRRTGKLTKVDLSKNYRLRYFEVDGNNLTELRLPDKNSNIEEIHCVVNKLESLDLSKCPKLKYLYCWENSLTTLDLSNNQLLMELHCAQNDFSSGLDVSANKELRSLACNNTFMQAIDISANIELIELVCYDNAIKDIDVSKNKELSRLDCSNNLLKKIDLSHNTLLNIFTCENNYLKEIDVSQNPNLKVLRCGNNQISSIDISMLAKLEDLSFGDNNIAEPIDLSIFPDLAYYGGNNLPLGRIPDFSHNSKLIGIHICGSGGAIYMDEAFFRQWPEIKEFNISSYQGESIDLSLNTKMESLWMGDMPNVRILDLSASPNLKFVCLNECRKLEKVYLHRDVDISGVEFELNNVHATIELK